jgi:YVTN family beta-propeller protein
MAIDAATGQIWVADTKQNRIQIVQPDCTGLEFIGDYYGGSAANQFYWPYGVAIRQTDRIAFVADTENNRIKTFNVQTRAQLAIYGSKGSGFAQFRRPAGIAVSPVDGHIFVADSENNRIKELSSTNGVQFTTVRTITGFLNPEGVAIDAQGRIYVADSGNDRVVILDANRTQIATITADGLHHPATVGVDAAGRVYVSDTLNDRVLVYQWSVVDTTPADGTITHPANNAQVPLAPLTATGMATDNVGVTTVDVAIKRSSTNQWWNGTGWQTSFKWNAGTVASPGATSTSWSYAWTPPASGSYQITVRAGDAALNYDPTRPYNTFSVVSATDTTPPDATVTVPAANQAFPNGPVAFNGLATDNVGVTSVQVAVRNRTTGRWWSGTAWQPTFKWFAAATLGTPGGASTTWQYTWTPPATGIYALMVRADDAAGNQDPTKPYVNFSVT